MVKLVMMVPNVSHMTGMSVSIESIFSQQQLEWLHNFAFF